MTQNINLSLIQRTASAFNIEVVHNIVSNFHKQIRNDLSGVFINQVEFAIPIQYLHYGNKKTNNYYGIFDDMSKDEKLGMSDFVVVQPKVTMDRYSLEQQPRKGDILTIKGIKYSIDTIEDDGTGETTIFLIRKGKTIN